MLGLEDKEKREQAEFVVKTVVLIISAVWILLVGTDYLDKQGKALDFRNKSLGIESNPTADTQVDFFSGNPRWFHPPRGSNLCTVTGQYRIKNTGRLNFRIETVTFEVYRLPVFTGPDLSPREVNSTTPAILLNGMQPIHRETIGVSELVGLNNELQRNFGFIIRERPGSHYMVVANATGGLPLQDESERPPGDRPGRFGARDLQHFSAQIDICGPGPPPPAR